MEVTLSVSFDQIYKNSLNQPEIFWGEAAHNIHWHKPWRAVSDGSSGPKQKWFPGGELNTCYNAVDIHVENGYGDQTAIIYDSPVTDTVTSISFRELQERTARLAGTLKELSVNKGDRVIIYMPMIPETVVAMLACARLGAVHSVVFGGFAANELAVRIDDCQPKAILTASCGIEGDRVIPYKPLLDEALDIANHQPGHCLVLQRPQCTAELKPKRDIDWAQAVSVAKKAPCVIVSANDPLYILYTSGTTGKPKGVVRDNGGHAVALKWSMENIYGVKPGEVFWAASDVGWVVGHSYIVYGPLLNRNTTIVFEGKPVGTPNPGTFWRIVDQHKVAAMFTAPTAIRAIRKEDASASHLEKYSVRSLRTLFLAGERTDPDTLEWAQKTLNIPVVDHWWQTETGWSICANCVGIEQLPIKVGSPTKPVPGVEVRVLNDDGQPVPPGETGALVVKLPLPPGNFTGLWQAEARFIDTYFSEYPGFYKTADAGYIDKDGYVFVMSRTDDIINVAGHRLSTGAIEEVLTSHPDVAECAVTGMNDPIKGQVPIGFLVLSIGSKLDEPKIIQDAIQLVRQKIGPVAAFKSAVVVKRLPKTRSGKILRGTLQKIANAEEFKMPATIDDPEILDEIKLAINLMPKKDRS